jgi:uncharacterized protein (TIGR00162 family)
MVSEFILNINEKPKLTNPVLIEGLPGIGQVGKIAAEYLVENLKAEKFASLYSYDFPPQVLVQKNGKIDVMKNEFYYHKGKRDMIFLIGNTQAATNECQYKLSEKILNVSQELGCNMIYTLGGFGIGRTVDKPKVYGAVTSDSMIEELEKLGVILERSGVGHIIGASGLLLGLGMLKNIDGMCLMGETSGFYIDPNSSKAVLTVLGKHLGIEIDLKSMEEKAKEVEKMTEEAAEIEKKILEEMGATLSPESMPDQD